MYGYAAVEVKYKKFRSKCHQLMAVFDQAGKDLASHLFSPSATQLSYRMTSSAAPLFEISSNHPFRLVGERVSLVRELLVLLADLGRSGLSHRDLHLDNIVLSPVDLLYLLLLLFPSPPQFSHRHTTWMVVEDFV